MLMHKIQLFGVVSIWISTVCAHRRMGDNDAERFKKETTFGIAIVGLITTILPI